MTAGAAGALFIGCDISFIDLSFDDGFRIDAQKIARAVNRKTRLISITSPHNPTGTMVSWDELPRIDRIAEQGCLVPVDETYRDLTYGARYPTAASISERIIAVSSLSKAYGTPGLRLGWLVTRNRQVLETFLAAKEQIGICGSTMDEALGVAALEGREAWLARSNQKNLKHLKIVREWLATEEYMEWVEPAGGVVCFPRMKIWPGFDLDRFYQSLLENHGTYVGAGHWFEMPRNYMRIGFAWPTEEQLRDGLAGISAAIREQL